MLREKNLTQWATIKVLAEEIVEVADMALHYRGDLAVADSYRRVEIITLQRRIDGIIREHDTTGWTENS